MRQAAKAGYKKHETFITFRPRIAALKIKTNGMQYATRNQQQAV
jgi:hypothetical protein